MKSEADGPCLYKHNLEHLAQRHKYEGRNVNVVEVPSVPQETLQACQVVHRVCAACFNYICAVQHLALIHAAQPGAENVSKATAVDQQTIEEYVNEHIWARTASNKRFRKFLAGSSLFASTTAGARPGLVEWYYTQTDSLLEQPSAFLTEDSETLLWVSKDEEWVDIHKHYSTQMANSQVCCRDFATHLAIAAESYMSRCCGAVLTCLCDERWFACIPMCFTPHPALPLRSLTVHVPHARGKADESSMRDTS